MQGTARARPVGVATLMQQFGSADHRRAGSRVKTPSLCARDAGVLDDLVPTHGLRFHKGLELGWRTLPDRSKTNRDELVDDVLGMHDGVHLGIQPPVNGGGEVIKVLSDATWFRGRDASYLAPPAQIRTCGFPAYGSHLGYRRQFGAVDEPTSCATLTRLGVRRVLCWPAFPSVPALRSTNSAADPSALFVGFPATMAGSDFSCPYIIGYGSSPSRCGPSRSRNI